jgi:hypothetical protein
MRHRFSDTTGRHRAPMPEERRIEQPFVYDPDSGRLIAPWPRGKLRNADAQRLDAVIERIATIEAGTLIWIRPDDREPVPIAAASPYHWLAHWSRDRASYSAG